MYRGSKVLPKIIVIKPHLIGSLPSDLLGYYRDNPAFPREPTSDQFFDEQQWESYRKLGVECCKAVLNLGPQYGKRYWPRNEVFRTTSWA